MGSSKTNRNKEGHPHPTNSMHAEESSSLQAVRFAIAANIKVDRSESDCAANAKRSTHRIWGLSVRDSKEFAVYKFDIAADGVDRALCQLYEPTCFEANNGMLQQADDAKETSQDKY